VTDADLDALLTAQRRSYTRAGEGLRRARPQKEALDREGLRSLLDELVYSSPDA
jgi:hypothetical protein